MSVPVVKSGPVAQGVTVTQYWLCSPVDIFQKGEHIYEIEGAKYSVGGYLDDLRFAKAVCSGERRIAEVEVQNYTSQNRLAGKKNWTFKAWV